MLNPTICARCFQANEPGRAVCWKCMWSLAGPPGKDDYIRLLSLPPSWNKEELRAAYHLLAKKYHPDINPDDREADAYFKFVNQAYELLSLLAADPGQADKGAGSGQGPAARAKSSLGMERWELYLKMLAKGRFRSEKSGSLTTLQKLAHWLHSPFS